MAYKVQIGDSPARIARRFGIPMSSLIRANPHKPVTVVAGQHTWRGISVGEAVNVPGGGTVGDYLGAYAPGSITGTHATIRRGSSGTDVATWQAFLGLTADGIFGANTESATRAFQSGHGLTADGVVGPKTWAAAQGSISSQTQAAQTLFAARAPTPAPLNAPHAQIRKGSTGPDVALWQTIVRVTPDGIFGPITETATKAWQAAHGLAADGIVGPKTWGAALSSAGPIAPAPTASPAPTPVSFPTPSVPTVAPVSVAAAVQALAGVDPCYSGNAMMVCAAQAALGITPDGKYGPATAAAVKRLVPGAPAACNTPLWWGKKTDNKCTGGVAPSVPAPSLPLPATPAASSTPAPAPTPIPVVIPPAPLPSTTVTATATSPGGPAQPAVIAPAAPEEKKISTGALVAGGLGIAALVGVVAVAASGKKGHRTSGGRRKPVRRRAAKRHSRKRRR